LQTERVVKGTVYFVMQNILGYFFSFLFYILIARVLGATEIGKLSLLLMVSSVFTLINLSINFALQKFIPAYIEEGRGKEIGRVIRTGLAILLPVSSVALIVVIIFSSQLSYIIFGSTTEGLLITIIVLASFILNITTFFGGEMLGLGKFKETAFQTLLNVSISRVLAIVLAFIGLGLVGVTLGWLIAATITLAFSLYVLRGRLYLEKGLPVKKILDFSLPIHVFAVLTFIQGWADIAILYALATDLSNIGTYYLVVSGATILSLLYAPISMTILPALSARYSRDGVNGTSPMIDTYIRIVCKILVPVGVSFAVLSATAIEVAFGSQYIIGAVPFAMIAATSIIPALALLTTTIIQSIGNTKPLIIIGISSAAADILTVAVFASSLGGIAGAAGRIVFSTIGLALGYYFIRKKIKLHLLRELKQPLIASIAIASPLFIIDNYLHALNITLRIRAPIDISAFIALAVTFTYVTKYFKKEDFELINQAIPKQLRSTLEKIETIFT